MRITPEIDTVSIVFVGDLNPRIFRPDWFVAQGLLPKEALDAAEIEIIHPELSKFSVEWLTVQVEKIRFVARTDDPPHIRLSDLVARTFGEFLIHTPVHMIGINRAVHFPVKDMKTLDAIGKILAPQDAWGEWGPMIEGTATKHGGMRSLTMEQTNLDDRQSGYIRAKVEPSSSLPPPMLGVYVDINDHYQLSKPGEAVGCEGAVAIVRENFQRSIDRSAWIVDQIMMLTE